MELSVVMDFNNARFDTLRIGRYSGWTRIDNRDESRWTKVKGRQWLMREQFRQSGIRTGEMIESSNLNGEGRGLRPMVNIKLTFSKRANSSP